MLARRAIPAVLATTAVLLAAPVSTGAPTNDDRAAAQPLTGLPVTATGTTATATRPIQEPPACGSAGPNVWYEIRPRAVGERFVVALQANGDLDVELALFARRRSQLATVDCELSDARGRAQVGARAAPGATYLVSVSQLANSVPGTFSLQAFVPVPPATPPGRPLPGRSVRQNVDPLANPSDAWAVELEEGVTYRVNLVTDGNRCARLRIFGPGVEDFDGAPLRTQGCEGYMLFTPGSEAAGRHSFLVDAAGRRRGTVTYRLSVALAGADDTAPGKVLANDIAVPGVLRGARLDVVDLYRFDVLTRSELSLDLRAARGAGFDLELVGDGGGRIACECDQDGPRTLRRTLGAGRYFVAVRAREGAGGRYILRRLVRQITSARLVLGEGSASLFAPGQAIPVTVSLTPAVAGPVRVVLERFDPLAGWQHSRTVRIAATAGIARTSFRPTAIGRWRVRASFLGTRTANPSESPHVRALVETPLAP